MTNARRAGQNTARRLGLKIIKTLTYTTRVPEPSLISAVKGQTNWDNCCGSRMATTSTIRKAGYTIRYKKCSHCGTKGHTKEVWKDPVILKPGTRKRPKLRLAFDPKKQG